MYIYIYVLIPKTHEHKHGHTLTSPPLAVVNTLVVSPPFPYLSFPFLSCTAPDKQHQKQHSHQPQRKHPFTRSGIYLLTRPSPVCLCVPDFPPPLCPLRPLPSPYPTPVFLHLCVFFLSVHSCWFCLVFIEPLRWPKQSGRS